ncbi:hypothetical protein SteCoe_30073 [Stentor coeruleus]|uniref:AAA+ ATPase domain-containing protein n=1 Tax=Stentor coeruleus TaxID=5963 RepID=A0A1R2B4E2_9CILI|nr:hypothetical protein SteCoe_30073 [Stentor coeruleus]
MNEKGVQETIDLINDEPESQLSIRIHSFEEDLYKIIMDTTIPQESQRKKNPFVVQIPSIPTSEPPSSKKLPTTSPKNFLQELKEKHKESQSNNLLTNSSKSDHIKKSTLPANIQNIINSGQLTKNLQQDKKSAISLLEKLDKKLKPTSNTFPFNGKFKFDKKEALALEDIKKWKKQTLDSDLPDKRSRDFEDTEFLIKKPKCSKPLNKDFLKEQSQIFSVQEFISQEQKRFQDEREREKKELEQRQQKIIEELNYRKSMSNFKYVPQETQGERYLEKEREKRRKVINETQEFYNFILNLNIRVQEPKEFQEELPILFAHGGEYVEKFQNAFFEEVRGEIFSALQQNNISEYCVVIAKVHSTHENFTFLAVKGRVIGTFDYFGRVQPDDLVILSPYKKDEDQEIKENFNDWKNKTTCILGFVERIKFEGQYLIKILEKFVPLFLDEETIESPADNEKIWRVFIVDSCTTMLREFKMIRMAEFLDMGNGILNPSTNPLPIVKSQVLEEFLRAVEKFHNESQIMVIEKACSVASGILLLQGPPGTGKTHTVKGILSGLVDKHKGQVHILVCAPSNAAINEIAKRVLVDKLYDHDGKAKDDLNLLRLGNIRKSAVDMRERQKSIRETPAEVEKITLNNKLNEYFKGDSTCNQYIKLIMKLNRIDKDLKTARKIGNKDRVNILLKKKSKLKVEIGKEKRSNQEAVSNRKQKAFDIINKANIIFTTLSAAASKEMLYLNHDMDYLIIDEACQSVELSTLIPFQYKAKVVILVGDPMQLPATTFSYISQSNQYSRSLFERLMQGGYKVHMLTIQYRMLTDICEFPSKTFYENRLETNESIISKSSPEWIKNKGTWFINLLSSQELHTSDDTSISNIPEADFILKLYKYFYPLHQKKLEIGVITPYKKQVLLIRDLLTQLYENDWKIDIEVNTIDGFQGREKDVIIFSAVRSGNSIGFLADNRRMNVAITRAKFALWVIGSLGCLEKNNYWESFICDCKKKNRVICCKGFEEVESFFTPESQRNIVRNDVKIEQSKIGIGFKKQVDLKNRKVDSGRNARRVEREQKNTVKENDYKGLYESIIQRYGVK